MTSEYNPFKTAIKRGGALSKPMSILLTKKLLHGKILDFGCGYGEDVKMLSVHPFNYNIQGYDKYSPEFSKNYALVNDEYDIITCNYMFNVIPDLETHRVILDTLLSMCKVAYIAVRSDTKAIKKNWTFDERNFSYWTGKSYQRFYNDELICRLFGEVEYIVKNNSFILFKLKGSGNNE